MKVGRVLGTVTLSEADPQFRGARWLVVGPLGAEELADSDAQGFSGRATPVVYDALGAGVGDAVLYVEGAEAMQPFEKPIPIDAITVALLDTWTFEPPADAG